jgi:hypothetical protein
MVLGLQHLGELGERLDSLNETMRALDGHLVEMSTSFESVAHSLEKLTSTLGYLDTPLKIATAPLEPVQSILDVVVKEVAFVRDTYNQVVDEARKIIAED